VVNLASILNDFQVFAKLYEIPLFWADFSNMKSKISKKRALLCLPLIEKYFSLDK